MFLSNGSSCNVAGHIFGQRWLCILMFRSSSNPSVCWMENKFSFHLNGFDFIKLIPCEGIQNCRCFSVTTLNFLACCICHVFFFSVVRYLPGRSHERRDSFTIIFLFFYTASKSEPKIKRFMTSSYLKVCGKIQKQAHLLSQG